MIALVNHIASADQALFHLVNGAWTTPLLDRMMPLLSKIGDLGAVWFAILGALAAFGKTTGRKVALAGLAAFAIGFAGAEVLKEIVLRPRPFAVLPDVRLLIPEPGSFAFPSGHTASSFAVASGAVLAARKLLGRVPLWGWPMLALAAAISYSRVYVGVHWPSDVAAGILFGVFSGWPGAKFGLEFAPRLGGLPKQRKAKGPHDPGNTGAATLPVEYAMSGPGERSHETGDPNPRHRGPEAHSKLRRDGDGAPGVHGALRLRRLRRRRGGGAFPSRSDRPRHHAP